MSTSQCPVVLVLLCLLGCAASAADRQQAPPRERFRQAKNCYLYYADGHVDELARYDVAVMHAPKMTADNVRALNTRGVVTIGYISVGEDEELRVGNGQGPGGKASWYFDRNGDGRPDANDIWHSVYANAADPAWRADRIAEAHRLVNAYGYQGFFLDTIEVPDIFPESRPGMIRLIQELRREFPDKVIVANRAFSLLKEPGISSNIDGVLYESFSSHYDFDEKHYIRFTPSDLDGTRKVVEDCIRPAQQKYPHLRVLALDYTEPTDREWIQVCFDRAVTFGFLPCVTSINLDAVFDTANVVGRADEKYLRKLATPESMQVTLDEARNGFPRGTIVQPSSVYPNYTVAAVVDGIKDRGKLHWSKANWASGEESDTAQSLTFLLGEPVNGGTLRVRFAADEQGHYASRTFIVESMSSKHSEWQTVRGLKDNRDRTVDVAFPKQPLAAVRITQPPNGGSAQRPNLMWVEQVELVR